MAHGTKDWDPPNVIATLNSIDDLGELAARLGSPAHFDRRGEVIRIESFENGGVRYQPINDGVGGIAERSLEAARSGRWSFKLSPADDGASSSGVILVSSDAAAGRIGAEISFSTPGTFGDIGLTISHNDGALTRYAIARLTPAAETVNVAGTGGRDVIVGARARAMDDIFCWNTLKLVADFTTGQLMRLLYNEAEFAITDILLSEFAGDEAPRLIVTVDAHSRPGNNDIVYLDDLIITQNEPV